MTPTQLGLAAGLGMLLAACTTAPSTDNTKFGAPPGPASTISFKLIDGSYSAIFPGGVGCGTMVIARGGSRIDYSAGPCGGSPNFRSAGSFDGRTIRILQAIYTLSDVTAATMTGRWTLGSYSQTVAFRK